MAFPTPAGPLKFGFQNVQPPADASGAFDIADRETTEHLVKTLERNGFDAMWAGDHLAFAQPIMEPLIQLAQASAFSNKLMLGTAVYLLPLRHPAGVAKQLATLDRMLEGRLTVNVISSDLPGAPLESGPRYALSLEVMQILRDLLDGKPVDHQGEFFRLAVDPPRIGTVTGSMFSR